MIQRALLLSSALALAACGGSSSPGDGDDGSEEPLPDEPGPSGPVLGDWQTLIEGDWELPAGTEDYVCVRTTIDEEIFVGAFEAINPLGTHHTLLTMGDPSGPDGITPCNAATNHALSIFGSGVGTNPVEFPDRVAMKIPAGTQLLLNLHLFNTDTEALTGTSGTRMRTIEETAVDFVAEGLIAGPVNLNIPPHEESVHSGRCEMSHDVTLFAIAPHMHQMGKHMKISLDSVEHGQVVLHDEPYSFEEQLYYPIDPVELATGDAVEVECTHFNPTDEMVHFGDSSLQEMCFAGLYRYPADGSIFACASGF